MKNDILKKCLGLVVLCSGGVFASWGPACVHFQEIAWNQAGVQLEITCNESAPGPNIPSINYRYIWNAGSNTPEHAKALLSILLTAKATNQRVKFDRGTLNGSWYDFTGVSILD